MQQIGFTYLVIFLPLGKVIQAAPYRWHTAKLLLFLHCQCYWISISNLSLFPWGMLVCLEFTSVIWMRSEISWVTHAAARQGYEEETVYCCGWQKENRNGIYLTMRRKAARSLLCLKFPNSFLSRRIFKKWDPTLPEGIIISSN